MRYLASHSRKQQIQDLIVYTDGSVTKDQSGWGFTVKQGTTTIHEDSAAYKVSTSSLTMEVEAVTHALRRIASRGDSQTTHVIILTDRMSLLHTVKNSKTPVGVQPWTCQSEGKLPNRYTGGQSNPHKWLASRKI